MFLLFGLAGSIQAQVSETFRFDFTVYGLHPGDFEEIYYLDPEGEPAMLEFRRRQRSPVYSAQVESPGTPLRFFRIRDSGEDVFYETVGEVIPEPNWSDMLLLFVRKPGDRDTAPFRIYAADDDVRNFPFGSVRIINLTGIPLGGSIDQQRERIQPGSWTNAFRIRRPGNVDVLFAAATSESVHLVYRRTMPLGTDSRTLLILRPPARLGSIRIGATTLQDFKSE